MTDRPKDAMQRERAEHVEQCPECLAHLEKWEHSERRLLTWAERRIGRVPSDQETEDVISRAEAKFGSRSGSKAPGWVLGLASGLGVLFILALSWVVFHQGSDSKDVPVQVGDSGPLPAVQDTGLWVTSNDQLEIKKLGVDKIALTPHSRAKLPSSIAQNTEVVLQYGEVICLVAPMEPNRMFTVSAGLVEVRVKGTIFSVIHQPKEQHITVLVARGTVEVYYLDTTVLVEAGQQWSSRESVAVDAPSANLKTMEDLFRLDDDVAPLDDVRINTPPVQSRPPARSSAAPNPKSPSSKNGSLTLERWRNWILSGEYDKAESAINRHLRTQSTDAAAWNLLADIHRKSGRWEQSVKSYENVIAHGEGSKANRARYMLAGIYQTNLSNHKKAVFHLRNYLEFSSPKSAQHNMAKIKLARSLAQTGNRSEAIVLLQGVIRLEKDSIVGSNAQALLETLQD